MPETGSYSRGLCLSGWVFRSHAYRRDFLSVRRCISAVSIVIAGIAALLVCRWYMAVRCGTYSRCHVAVRWQCRVDSVGRSARSLVIGLVRMHIGTRLVGSQGISVATVIGFIAAADTGNSSFCGLLP